MNILHIGDNICGIPNSFKCAEIQAGHNAKVLSFVPDPQGHLSDYDFNEPTRSRRLFILLSLARQYQTFVFTGDTIIWGFDILLWKLLGKKVAIHYHGSEVRGKGKRFFHRFADALFVATPDLLSDVPEAVWLPNPIFMENYKEHYTIGVIITHAPTNRDLKGTEYIIKAVENAKHHFPLLRLNLVEGLPYNDALEQYRKSAAMVDQLNIGWYGMVALECMAMGVPVMCYIREDLKPFIECSGFSPIWYTSKETIEDDIATLLSSSCTIVNSQSDEGKDYVTGVHHPKKVVQTMLKSIGG